MTRGSCDFSEVLLSASGFDEGWKFTWSRAILFLFYFLPVTGHEPKLMNRDKCSWLCFVEEKLPNICGNAFSCSARFAQQNPQKKKKSVPRPHLLLFT